MSEVNDRSDTAAGAAPCEAAPSCEQRLALVRSYQAEALRRQGPLAARLGALKAGLLSLAHGLARLVQGGLARGPAAGRQRPCQGAVLYLKLTRQIDRLAQLERRPPTAFGAGGEGGA
jgi:hypothetical protein